MFVLIFVSRVFLQAYSELYCYRKIENILFIRVKRTFLNYSQLPLRRTVPSVSLEGVYSQKKKQVKFRWDYTRALIGLKFVITV